MPEVTVYSKDRAFTKPIWQELLRTGSRGEQPRLEWEFLIRARRSRDTRQKVIDAVTAVEVALSRRIEAHLMGLNSSAKERILRSANGVVELLRLVKDIEPGTFDDISASRAMHRLAGPRNMAVHQGTRPTQQETNDCVSEAWRLTERLSPLRKPQT